MVVGKKKCRQVQTSGLVVCSRAHLVTRKGIGKRPSASCGGGKGVEGGSSMNICVGSIPGFLSGKGGSAMLTSPDTSATEFCTTDTTIVPSSPTRLCTFIPYPSFPTPPKREARK